MSFMGPKPEGLSSQNPERTESRFSGPLPMVHGTNRLVFRHIEHPWAYRTEKTGDNGQDPADYYSMAGWICLGVVHSLRRIYVGGRPVDLFMDNPEDGSKYLDLEIPYYVKKHTPIRFRFYWGYDDQLVDPLLNGQSVTLPIDVWGLGDNLLGGSQSPDGSGGHQTGSRTYQPAPNSHPPYGGICYAVFYAFETGWPLIYEDGQEAGGGPRAGGPTIPNIEFEIFKRPSIVTGFENAEGVNPAACNYDYFTDPRGGLGLPDSVVPAAAWTAMVNKVVALRWQGLHRLSPVLAKGTPAASAVSKLNAYFGGLLKARNGQLLPDILPEQGDATFSVLINNAGFNVAGSGAEPFDGWTKEGAVDPVRDTSDKYEGDASMRLDVGGSWQDTGVYQNLVTLTPGKTYIIEVSAKAANGGSLKIGSNANWSGYAILVPSTIWARFEVEFTAVDTGLHIHINNAAPASSSVWVDAVVIREVVPEITEHDLTEDPEFEPLDSEDPISEVTVKYLNIDEKLEDDSISERVSLPTVMRGEPKTEEVDGEHIRKNTIARLYAFRVLAGLGGSGVLNILRSKAKNADGTPFLAGDVFRWNYGPWGLQVPLRVEEVDDQGTDSIRFKVQVERGLYPENYTPVQDTRNLPAEPDPEDFVYYKALELPIPIGGNRYPANIAILAHRENFTIYGFDIFMTSEQDIGSRWTGEEILLATQTSFAVRGTLNTGISDSDTQVILDLDSTDYDNFLSEGFSIEEQIDDSMLLLIGNEYLSLGELVDNTGQQWTFAVERGRADSTAATHSTAAEVWLIKKSTLLPLSHNTFLDAPLTVWFRIIPKVIGKDGDASAEFSLALSDPKPSNVSNFNVTFVPSRYWNQATWDEAQDNNLRTYVIERNIAATGWVEVARLPAGATLYEDKYVAGVGGIQSFAYRIYGIDDADGISPQPWPEASVNVPELPAGGLSSIPQVADFQFIARNSTTQGERFYAQWTKDGAAEDVIKFRLYPTADESKAVTFEVKLGSGGGTKTMDIGGFNGPRTPDYPDNTQFTCEVQRGDVESIGTFYSTAVVATATMRQYTPAPAVPVLVAAGNPIYNTKRRQIELFYQAAQDDLLKHTVFEMRVDGGTWEAAGDPVIGQGKLLINGNPTAVYTIPDIYPGQVSKILEFRMRSVGYNDAASANVSFNPITINPIAFSATGLTVVGGPREMLFAWTAEPTSDDLFFCQILNPAWTLQRQEYPNVKESNLLFGNLEWTGTTVIRMCRGIKENGRVIWSAWAVIADRTVDEYAKPDDISLQSVTPVEDGVLAVWTNPATPEGGWGHIEVQYKRSWQNGATYAGSWKSLPNLPAATTEFLFQDPETRDGKWGYELRFRHVGTTGVAADWVTATRENGYRAKLPQPAYQLEDNDDAGLTSNGSTFTAARSATYTDRFYAPGHNLVDGEPIFWSTTGTLPDVVDAVSIFFARRIDNNYFQVLEDLHGPVNGVMTAGSGTHTVHRRRVELELYDVKATAVDSGENNITLPASADIQTGDWVQLAIYDTAGSSTSMPTGWSQLKPYYAERIGNDLYLYDKKGGTLQTITNNGTWDDFHVIRSRARLSFEPSLSDNLAIMVLEHPIYNLLVGGVTSFSAAQTIVGGINEVITRDLPLSFYGIWQSGGLHLRYKPMYIRFISKDGFFFRMEMSVKGTGTIDWTRTP